MIPFHVLIHVAVPSVSGHAVLTMPLFVPVADVLGFSRQVPVLAYQTGAGLTELATPTNGALMAVLLRHRGHRHHALSSCGSAAGWRCQVEEAPLRSLTSSAVKLSPAPGSNSESCAVVRALAMGAMTAG